MQLVRRPYDHADVIGLTEIVQAGYVELYGGPDETPVEPGEFAPPRGGFVVGYAGGPGAQTPIAMGGWRLRDDGRAELKRMFVHPDHRGQGLSREVLRWLETDAAAAGATALVLETGRPQVAAVELYRSAGYTDVEPFGYYAWSPTSVYLGRELGVVRTGQNGAVPQTDTALDPEIAALLKRDAAGLVAAVVQQHDTGEVLMVGWMNDDALSRTLTTGRVTFWSRSRNELWRKGDRSGHVQWVKSVALDCDGDALLVRVDQVGAACHTGDHTCFDARPLPAVVAADGDTKVATA